MLLAIDIGNTNIVFGIYDKGEWKDNWRIQTDTLKTADEYAVIFRSILKAGKICLGSIEKILICSVVPSLFRPIDEMLASLFPTAIQNELCPEIYPMLPVKVLNPLQIGSDLVANAVAAIQKYGTNTMVIDFGTALTFTTINKSAEIAGVAIAPGLQTAAAALAGKTAQLPQIHLSTPPSVLGDNTNHAIQAGIIFGYTGLVESIIARTEEELAEKLTVVATGGLSAVIAPLVKAIDTTNKMLTLQGLAEINEILTQ